MAAMFTDVSIQGEACCESYKPGGRRCEDRQPVQDSRRREEHQEGGE